MRVRRHPVDYYGAEHLLRLFVKFPELLARCQMQREHMTVLVSKVRHLADERDASWAATAHRARRPWPSHCSDPRACCARCTAQLGELLKFMVQQKAKYLSGEYEEPDDEYLVWWKENSD